MQSAEAYFKSHLNPHKGRAGFTKIPPFREKSHLSTLPLVIKKESIGKYPSHINPFFIKNNFSYALSQSTVQAHSALGAATYSQAQRCLFLIEDPLWKRVCAEIVNMMGPPSVLKIGNCRLGSLSPQDKIIDLYCPTEEIAQFVEQYAFVILGSLQRYFPALKELRVRTEDLSQEGRS